MHKKLLKRLNRDLDWFKKYNHVIYERAEHQLSDIDTKVHQLRTETSKTLKANRIIEVGNKRYKV